jgi:DNA-directed RNA polymerase subunit RPC12/RpoP
LTIEFNCPQCAKALRTSDDKAGRRVKCPECGSTLTVPQAVGGPIELLPVGDEFAVGTLEQSPRRSSAPIALDAGEVISTSWTIFKSQLGMLIGAVVIVGLLDGLVGLPANVIQNGLQNNFFPQNQIPTMVVAYFALLIVASLFQIYMAVGQTIFFLKIARGQPAEFGDLFRGGHYLLRALGGSILFGLMLGFGFALLIVPGVILSLMFWPFMYVLVDTDAPGMQCLSRAKEITPHTWGTVFVLWLTAVGLSILGVLACCVGLLFTVPLSLMLFAVAYCRMTGQPTVRG